MHPMILNRIPNLLDMVQLLTPVDLKDGPILGQNIPPETRAYAGERVRQRGIRRDRGGAVVPDTPAVPDIDEGCKLNHGFAAGPTPQGEARFDREEEDVIAQCRNFSIPADGVSSAQRELLEGKQRRAGQLQVHAFEQLHAEEFFAELLDPLSLSQPGEELAIRRGRIRIDRCAQGIYTDAKA